MPHCTPKSLSTRVHMHIAPPTAMYGNTSNTMRNRNSFLLCLAAYLLLVPSEAFSPGLRAAVLAAAWLATGGAEWLQVFLSVAPRDLKLFWRGSPFLLAIARAKLGDESVAQLFRRTALARHPDRVMFVDADGGGRRWTYRQGFKHYFLNVMNYTTNY